MTLYEKYDKSWGASSSRIKIIILNDKYDKGLGASSSMIK